MSHPLLIKIPGDIKKWKNSVGVIRQHYNDLTPREQSAFDFLVDHWSGKQDVSECNDLIAVMTQDNKKFHSNNKKLLEALNLFKEMCTTYYTKDAELFKGFTDELKKQGGNSTPTPTPTRRTSSTPPPATTPVNTQSPATTAPRVERLNYETTSGARYTGEGVNGIAHGRGTIVWPDGDKYEGEWQNGEITGRGVFTIKGRIDRGEYRNGYRVGRGSIVWPDGDRYEGGWNEKGPHGKGTFYYNDKSKYNGSYVDGRREGSGVYTNPQGQKFNQVYRNNELVQQPTQTRTPPPTPTRTNTRTSSPGTSTSTYSSGIDVMAELKKRKRKERRKVFFIVVVCLIGFALFGYFSDGLLKDDKAERTYVYVSNLLLRSSKDASADGNIVATIPYGSELITYNREGEWAEVKADKKKGFVSSAYILNKADFNRLNDTWGNEDSKEVISTAKCRLAILDYLKKNNLNNDKSTGKWQIHAKPIEQKPNSVFFPKLSNGYSSFTDFAFILQNSATADRKLALYSFEENETPVFVYDEQAPANGDIKNITYQTWNKKYKVAYGTATAGVPKTNAVNTQSQQTKKKTPITVTNIVFANVTKSNNFITPIGSKLYTNTQYLKPRVTYYTASDSPQTLKLEVKIIKPDGNLERGQTSPANYTFEQSVTFPGSTSERTIDNIIGWGNVEGNCYRAGRHTYEIWFEGTLLFRRIFEIENPDTQGQEVTRQQDAPQQKDVSSSPIRITNIQFANVTSNNQVLTNYGQNLYDDIQYLKARIRYDNLKTETSNIKLAIKIYRPTGKMIQGVSSPANCTFEQNIATTGNKQAGVFVNLTSWGSQDSNVYSPGKYRFEIWYENSLLLKKEVTIYKK